MIVVPPLHAALEDRAGHRVPKSTIYRLLARHGWRKLATDTRHTKQDEQAQEDLKKLSSEWQKDHAAQTSDT